MIKYVLTPNGVINRETGMTIKEPPRSKFWDEYLEWRNQGNIPIEMSPGNEYSLVGDEWVIDQTKANEIKAKKKRAKMRSTEELVKILIKKGIIAESEFEE